MPKLITIDRRTLGDAATAGAATSADSEAGEPATTVGRLNLKTHLPGVLTASAGAGDADTLESEAAGGAT